MQKKLSVPPAPLDLIGAAPSVQPSGFQLTAEGDAEAQSCSASGEILTVSQLNRVVATMLSEGLPLVCVEGELSNVTLASSGHWYFMLKDDRAQVRAVLFRGRAKHLKFKPAEGTRVQVQAQTSVYEARGEFQLTVLSMVRAGSGDLYQRFLDLKAKLFREGLFDADRKHALPSRVRVVGIVTSAQAAALQDVLTTLRQRAPSMRVIIYPCLVQGKEAPPTIIKALTQANCRQEADVLLLVRGGGSIEDLWAFNDEAVAYAVAASTIPVVSGVGHETDVTIADFVADLRAATPTAAAVAVSADRREQMSLLLRLYRQMAKIWIRRFEQLEQRVDLTARLVRSPRAIWMRRGEVLGGLSERLCRGIRQSFFRCKARLEPLHRSVSLMSPYAVLGRGYALVRDERGDVVRNSADVPVGSAICVSLAIGEILAKVQQVEEGDACKTAALRSLRGVGTGH